MLSLKEKKLNSTLKAAIIPSTGIGDSLIFLQAADTLKNQGYDVSFYHSSIRTLSPYISSSSIYPRNDSIKEDFCKYDLIIAQYDDSKETKQLIALRDKHPKFYVFYPSYKQEKHGPLKKLDFAANPKYSMVKNLKKALEEMFRIERPPPPTLDTQGLQFKKYPKRVVIHPFSKDNKKAWPLQKYLILARTLRKTGFEPIFVMEPEEEKVIDLKGENSFSKPSLSDLAAVIYESGYFIGNDSGPGHMASLLNIPSLIIADDHKRMKLWKPDFYPVKVITAARWIPNVKTMRFRKRYWAFFISVKKVLRAFTLLSKK